MIIEPKTVVSKNGLSIVLRSPMPEDAEIFLLHLRAVFRESYMNMNHPAGHFDELTEEKEAKFLADFGTSPNQFMISAVYDGRIIGNLGCFGGVGEFLKHSARIGMGLEKEFCGSGLGYELLRHAIESAKRIGLHRLDLTVRTFNQPGIRLYEKAGFSRTGLLKHVAFIDGAYRDEYAYELLL